MLYEVITEISFSRRHETPLSLLLLDIPTQEVITRDNAVILANAVAYINIISPEKAVYGVEDYEIAIQTLVQTSYNFV